MIIEISDKGCKIHILLILGNVCLSVTGFEEPNVNHKRDLGVVELGFGKSCRRPRINLQGCIVGDDTKLSTIPIGLTRSNFQKRYQMTYWHLGTLI